ncbi:MAG: response regulator [Desulfamplus sp.]|nr:response regulator [Desulfamplus sp.]
MGKGRVMIVDDNQENRLVASGFLEDDYEIVSLQGGNECLKNISVFNPDVILLDWMMDHPDGIETLRIIQDTMPEFRNVRVVMVTAKTQPNDIVTAWHAGANDYIVKPFEMDELLKIVVQQLAEKRRLDRQDMERAELKARLQQSQKMETIGVLAGGIAHDFNNILFPIMGYAEMTLWNPHVTDDIKENLQEIEKAAKRAQDLVRQILTFSRQTFQEPQMVEVGLILREVLKLLKPAFPANIEFSIELPSVPEIIFADPTQIHQIIMNLCTNAKHAMEHKGGKLSIKVRNIGSEIPDQTKATLKPKHRYLELKVSDTGEGIPKEIKNKIFEPFFTTKMPGKGTGMGLSVVHGIIKELGGEIFVESEVGTGTVFSVYLPIFEAQCRSKTDKTSDIIGGTENILVVDDETAIMDMLVKMLKDLGYHVRKFTSCAELIDTFPKKNADVLITDMSMPEMTGIELAQTLWQQKSDFPVILMTGFSEEVTKNEASKLGINEFLIKPVAIANLAQAIRRVLDKSVVKTG